MRTTQVLVFLFPFSTRACFTVDAMFLVFMHPQLPLDFYLKQVEVDNTCLDWQ